jgi:hypothetical protein
MKSGEGGFRHSRAPVVARPVISRAQEPHRAADRKTTGLGKRAQRRLEESEARRQRRKERKRGQGISSQPGSPDRSSD